MLDVLTAMREFRALHEKRQGSGLSEDEERRWTELQALLLDAAGEPSPEPGPAPEPAQSAAESDAGYVWDEESGWYWHPLAGHWYDPSSGAYCDAEGQVISEAEAQAAVAAALAGAAPPVESQAEEPLELAPSIDFLQQAAASNDVPPWEVEAPPAPEPVAAAEAPEPVAAAVAPAAVEAPPAGDGFSDDVPVEVAEDAPPSTELLPFDPELAPAEPFDTRRLADWADRLGDLTPGVPLPLPAWGREELPWDPATPGPDQVMAWEGMLLTPGPAAVPWQTVESVSVEPSEKPRKAQERVAAPVRAKATPVESPPEPSIDIAIDVETPAEAPAPPKQPEHKPDTLRSAPPPPPAVAEEPPLPPAVAEEPPPPPRVPGEHRVVVHLREGTVKRGKVRDADLAAPILRLDTATGPEELATESLKVVFFMLAPGERAPSPDGRKVHITFADGRPLTGFTLHAVPEGKDFFLTPTDARGNASRIYVYRHAVRHLALD